MANKQDVKLMIDNIMSRKGFNIPPLTDLEKKELKERTLLAIEQFRKL